jgi:gp16 family phage-associated protein
LEQINNEPKGLATVQDVRQRFVDEGLSINAWAKARGYKPRTVYAVLQGQLECRHGISHQIAVDLGLKAAPSHSFLKRGAA